MANDDQLSELFPSPAPNAPVSDVDLFSDEALLNPYPVYDSLREMGSAVWLSRFGFLIFTRYDDVKGALSDPDLFTSNGGPWINWGSAMANISASAMVLPGWKLLPC